MDSSQSSEDENFDPDEIVVRDFEAEKKLIVDNLLPKKSRAQYEMEYSKFFKWKDENHATDINENVLIVYFEELSNKWKPSILWSVWSKLRTTLSLRHQININNYDLLKSFMKNTNKGYKPKKSSILSMAQIKQFLASDDKIYLSAKVLLIFGIFGALRCTELINLSTTDIEELGNQYLVSIKESKNDYPRTFIIGAEYYSIVKKYIELRPTDMPSNRFFVNYQHGVCTKQFIGKNRIRETPKTIALYLNLNNPESYTGHCFRRSAATALSNAGANLTMVKQLGGWRSDLVAQGYIENSMANRRAIFENMNQSNKNGLQESVPSTSHVGDKQVSEETNSTSKTPLSNIPILPNAKKKR